MHDKWKIQKFILINWWKSWTLSCGHGRSWQNHHFYTYHYIMTFMISFLSPFSMKYFRVIIGCIKRITCTTSKYKQSVHNQIFNSCNAMRFLNPLGVHAKPKIIPQVRFIYRQSIIFYWQLMILSTVKIFGYILSGILVYT